MRKGQPQRRSLKLYFHILITNFIMRVKELLQSVLCRCVIESDLNRIKKAINKYSVISFDIFDTLLQRIVSTPSDVFDLVEKEYNKLSSIPIRGFKQIRIEAELKSKKQSLTEETNIYSIYNMLPYDKEVRDLLLQLELKIERIELSARQEIKALYDYAAFLRKEVIIISDMYLPVGFIEEILYANGYRYHSKLYVSSATGVLKSTGNMFRFVLKNTGYRTQDVLHIGDNILGDYICPKSLKIKSICI